MVGGEHPFDCDAIVIRDVRVPVQILYERYI